MELLLVMLAVVATITAIYYRNAFEKASLEILNLEEKLDEEKVKTIDAEKRDTRHFKKLVDIEKEIRCPYHSTAESLSSKIKEILANPKTY